MTRNIFFGTLIALSASVSPLAHAIPTPPVDIDLGTISVNAGSKWACGDATDSLPTDLYQASTIQSSGQVAFAPDAYTNPIPNTNGGVQLCVYVSWNLSAQGPFSGVETIQMDDGERVRVIVAGNYQ